MPSPVKTFTHDGDDWQVMFTWGCASREGYTIGVLFLAKTTNREGFGRLRGIPPEHFDHATVDQLREALIAALSGDDRLSQS
jgi:hypothetical protein